MQLTNTPGKLVLPFAASGAKNAIPVASQIGIVAGAASLTDGFPPLTRTPLAAGGVPPSGLDMNGIIYELSAILRWANAGAGYVYDGTFAADSNVGGYPKGARVLRTDGEGYWLNTSDNNTTDPESAGAGVAAAAGWVPDFANGVTTVTMASANVTLTPVQYGKPVIVITGTLTANLNLIFPNIVNEWTVLNNTTGAFTITCKTAAGTGIVVNAATIIVGDGTNIQSAIFQQSSIQSVSASVASNALTLGYAGGALQFRSATLTNGAPNTRTVSATLSLVVPTSATLGTVSAVAARLAILAIDNAGTVELAVVNLAGGNNLDETTLINTTAISAGATSASVIYSTTARTGVPFRVVGFVDITEATAGTWATAPTTVQGEGGQALAAMQSLGYGQTWQNVTGSRASGVTYYNTTGRPIQVSASAISSATVGSYGIITGQVGAVTVSSQAATSYGSVVVSTVTFIVPPGASYVCTLTAGSLNFWSELR